MIMKNIEKFINKSDDTDTDNQATVINFGIKRIPRQGYSRMIVLDKKLLENCGCNTSPDSEIKAKVQLVKTNNGDFIKIIPFHESITTKLQDHSNLGEIN